MEWLEAPLLSWIGKLWLAMDTWLTTVTHMTWLQMLGVFMAPIPLRIITAAEVSTTKANYISMIQEYLTYSTLFRNHSHLGPFPPSPLATPKHIMPAMCHGTVPSWDWELMELLVYEDKFTHMTLQLIVGQINPYQVQSHLKFSKPGAWFCPTEMFWSPAPVKLDGLTSPTTMLSTTWQPTPGRLSCREILALASSNLCLWFWAIGFLFYQMETTCLCMSTSMLIQRWLQLPTNTLRQAGCLLLLPWSLPAGSLIYQVDARVSINSRKMLI